MNEPVNEPAVIATTPEPPYVAVIFTSLRTADDDEGYALTAGRMVELARTQPGFLGVESARAADGLGITVSYWTDEAHVAAWKRHAEHTLVRATGRERWYRAYTVRVCRVERAYGSAQPDGSGDEASRDDHE